MNITDKREEEEEEGERHQPLAVKIVRISLFYLVIGFLGWNLFIFMFSSDFFSIREVIIKGNDYLSKDEIFCKSGIKLGENFFKLNLKKSINSLKQESRIKEVEIKKIIPNKIVISLKERTEAAIIYAKERYFILSKEGMVLSKIDNIEKEQSLPLILGLKIIKPKIGEIINKPEFKKALEIINSANLILPQKYYIVKILAFDDFLLYDKDKIVKIRVNKAEEIINKENLIREALEKITKEKLIIEYIDIRFKDDLIIKLKK
jgi:cell division protein FtsQ